MPELPWVKWYPQNWSSEPGLSVCEVATTGIWINAVNAMMLRGTAQITGTVEELSRLCRCRPSQMSLAVAELKKHQIGEVIEQNGDITLACRRLFRGLEISRLRSDAGKASANKRSTSGSTPSTSTSTSYSTSFLRFYEMYPRKQAKADAAKAWEQIGGEDQLDVILASLQWQKRSQDWTKDAGKFVPYPASYLRAKRWEDEPQQKGRGQAASIHHSLPPEPPVTEQELKTRALMAKQMKEFVSTIAEANKP